MNKYQKITEARTLLGLPKRATIEEIKSNYRRLMRKWHPDHCTGDAEQCREMAQKLSGAYATIMEYCNHYQYSFAGDEVKNYLSPDEWWHDRFENDFIWSNAKKI